MSVNGAQGVEVWGAEGEGLRVASKDVTDVARALGVRWAALTPEQRDQYKARAAALAGTSAAAKPARSGKQ